MIQSFRTLTAKWPKTRTKLIEDKANGTAVIDTLKHEISGIIPINPSSSKVERVAAISPQIESGNVYLPHPLIAPWVNGFVDEFNKFPNGAHDDMVDQTSQALNRMNNKKKITIDFA